MVIENVSKQFEKTIKKKGKTKKESFLAVNDVSFEVKCGSIVGIIGPNGAGKTTLLRMLGHLMTPSSGEIRIFDNKQNLITDPLQIRRNIGYLSANTKLYNRFSIRELLTFYGDIYEMPKEEVKERIEMIIETLSLQEFCDNRIGKLSTGQTQRASIARVLLHDPSIYILDEPTSGLDILSSDDIIRFMKNQKELGKTILYSTHYLEEAEFLCDHILMIYQGKIIDQGSVAHLLDKTKAKTLREAFGIITQF